MRNYLSFFNQISQQFKNNGKDGNCDKREDLRFGNGMYIPSRIKGKTIKNWARRTYERRKKL